jgi:endogenous inhibitor of DNA gyrase (YacG/DUF329 family)
MKITYECVVCCATVTKTRSPKNMLTPPRYCSQKCAGVDRRNGGANRQKNVTFSCAVCGEKVETYRSPSALAQHEPKYCSVRCTGMAQKGEANPSFSGGRHFDAYGYVKVLAPDHPNADVRGYVSEHRLKMERKIGRFLTDAEVVHHIDGDTSNNDPSNLELFPSHSEHMRVAHGTRA